MPLACSNNYLRHGASFRCQYPFLLHSATWPVLPRLPGARVLLEAGAEVNAVNNEGFTPLMKAVDGKKSTTMVAILLNAGANQALKHSRGWQVIINQTD